MQDWDCSILKFDSDVYFYKGPTIKGGLRWQRGYRLLDSIITLRLLALVYPLLGRWRQRLVPKFARKQAMGIDSLFK